MQQDNTGRQRNYFASSSKISALQKVDAPSHGNSRPFPPKRSQPPPHVERSEPNIGRVSVNSKAAAPQTPSKSHLDMNGATRIISQRVYNYILKQKYKRMRKQHKYRACVIKEIVETEKRYIDDLVKILTLRPRVEAYITPKKAELIFMNTKQIYQLNSKMYEDLKEYLPYKPYQKLGKLFCEYAPFFRLYFHYYVDFKKSEETLHACLKESKELHKLNQELIGMKEYNNQNLESYLIKPVQRVPKYLLLLDDIIKHTDPDHVDYPHLVECRARFQEVNNKNNTNLDTQLRNYKNFELQRFFEPELQVVDSTRSYVTEQQLTMIHKSKEKTVLTFILTDLIITAEPQPNELKPYKLVFAVHLDFNSLCYKETINSENYKNLFTIKGRDASLTFIEQSEKLMQDRIKFFNDVIKSLISKKEERNNALRKQKLAVEESFLIKVTVQGVDERKTNAITSHKVYVVEVQIGEIAQKIFVRYSQCAQLQEEIKKKHPQCQLNHIKQHATLNFMTDDREIEGRMIQIQNFIASLLDQPFMRLETKYLAALGLPENFYDLPKLLTDEIRQQPRNRSTRGDDRGEQKSTRASFMRKHGSVQHLEPCQAGGTAPKPEQKFSASSIIMKEQKQQEGLKTKPAAKDQMQFIVHNYSQDMKAYSWQGTSETRAFELCEVLRQQFQLKDTFDYRLFIVDSKTKYKALSSDERLSDNFPHNFLLDFAKKKELYFRKYLFLDLAYEKQQLQEDHAKLSLVYNQLLQEVKDSQIGFKIEVYWELGAVYHYINAKAVSFELLQNVLPSAILKQEKREFWVTKINQALGQFLTQLKNTQCVFEEGTEGAEGAEVAKPVAKDAREGLMKSGSLFSTTVSTKSCIEPPSEPDVTYGQLKFISLCFSNEFCGKALFAVSCKELAKDYGETGFYLVIGFEGIALYNGRKSTQLENFGFEVSEFKVFPTAIQFSFRGRVYKFETTQGFQIQSLLDEYDTFYNQ